MLVTHQASSSDSIVAAVKVLSDELLKGHPSGTKLNVWYAA